MYVRACVCGKIYIYIHICIYTYTDVVIKYKFTHAYSYHIVRASCYEFDHNTTGLWPPSSACLAATPSQPS